MSVQHVKDALKKAIDEDAKRVAGSFIEDNLRIDIVVPQDRPAGGSKHNVEVW